MSRAGGTGQKVQVWKKETSINVFTYILNAPSTDTTCLGNPQDSEYAATCISVLESCNH